MDTKKNTMRRGQRRTPKKSNSVPQPKNKRQPKTQRTRLDLQQARERHFVNPQCTEPVAAITVPADSARGDLLYAVEINPSKLGRLLQAQATQAQSWAGDLEFQLRVNGSVNAKNYGIGRFLPDAKLSDLPAEGESLWRFIRASSEGYNNKNNRKPVASKDRAFIKYNVISNQASSVHASWTMSYNPIKPITDEDPTERNLGVFVIVSNGPPGEIIVIDVDVKYNVYLCGPTPHTVAINNSNQVISTPTSLSTPFGGSYALTGPGSMKVDPSALTLAAGSYIVTTFWTGTGFASVPTISSNAVIAGNTILLTTTATTRTFSVSSDADIVLTFAPASATTLTNVTVKVSMYDLSDA